MMVRQMFFVGGWPVLSPEPYTGSLSGNLLDGRTQEGWEFIRFDAYCNALTEAVHLSDSETQELIHAGKVHNCWDFENGRPTVAVTGYDNSGLAYWGKFVYSLF